MTLHHGIRDITSCLTSVTSESSVSVTCKANRWVWGTAYSHDGRRHTFE